MQGDLFFWWSRVRVRVPPGFRTTQPHVTTSLSTGGGPVRYVQLSEGGFHVVNPLGFGPRFSGLGVVKFV